MESGRGRCELYNVGNKLGELGAVSFEILELGDASFRIPENQTFFGVANEVVKIVPM